MATQQKKILNQKQKDFCHYYIERWNATWAAKMAGYSEKTAKEQGYQLLHKTSLQAYIQEIQTDVAKLAGVSALRNQKELAKIAYSNHALFRKDWMTLEEFEELTEEQKACISEIQVTTRNLQDKDGNYTGFLETVKFKLHDKQKAIEILNKMNGWNAPEKIESNNQVTTKIEHIGVTTTPEDEQSDSLE